MSVALFQTSSRVALKDPIPANATNAKTGTYVIIVTGAVALTGLAWGFWDYGAGLVSSFMSVNDAPTYRLMALNPANEYRVDAYGRLLDLLVLLYVVACVRTLSRAHRTNSPISRTAKVSTLIVPAFALMLWQLPYRAMYQSSFDRVDLDNVRCYQLGSNETSVLLHCPDSDPPRNRIVPRGDQRLHPR